jgi:hypothetical protein
MRAVSTRSAAAESHKAWVLVSIRQHTSAYVRICQQTACCYMQRERRMPLSIDIERQRETERQRDRGRETETERHRWFCA